MAGCWASNQASMSRSPDSCRPTARTEIPEQAQASPKRPTGREGRRASGASTAFSWRITGKPVRHCAQEVVDAEGNHAAASCMDDRPFLIHSQNSLIVCCCSEPCHRAFTSQKSIFRDVRPNQYCFSMSGWFRPMTVIAADIPADSLEGRIQQTTDRSLFFRSGAA
jgi:hypothetical protein